MVSNSFNMLDSRIQKWVWQQNWHSLKEIQESAIPHILNKNCDVIISASTAEGKTEAAFLPILSSLLDANSLSKTGYKVLYISPLKALINDQYRRLQQMTMGLNIGVTPWHGDVSASKKQKSLTSASGIIIITPESLEGYFVNKKQHLYNAFSNLEYIVIDELHSFVGSERGKQLQSLLFRVEHLSGRIIPRIALSATFSDFEGVRHYLRSSDALPCAIPNSGTSCHEVKILISEYLSSPDNKPQEAIATDLYQQLRGSSNLIFANSRLDVERYGSLLIDLCDRNGVPNEFYVHHGNLSKTMREVVEQKLQSGFTPTSAICTSTLELGVDIAKVKSIVQIGCANSVSAMRQRLGRSGRRGEPSILRIYSIDYTQKGILSELKANLFQNIAVVELLLEKRYEAPCSTSFHLSTLIQQILSTLCQHGGFQPKDGWSYLCKKGEFKTVTPAMFMALLKALGGYNVLQQTHTGEIVIGLEGERIVKSQHFYATFKTSVDYMLINSADHSTVGTLQYMPKVGSSVILGGRKWNVISVSVSTKKIFVVQVKQGLLPFFMADMAEVDLLVAQKMKEIYSYQTQFSYLNINANEALDSGRSFFNQNNLAAIPFYGLAGMSLFITWQGIKINRTISLMLAKIDGLLRPYNFIMVENVTAADIENLLQQSPILAIDLSLQITDRKQKEFQKFDYLLCEDLLNQEYAATYLDLNGAYNYLHLLER